MLFIYSNLFITFFIPIIYCQTLYELLNSFRFLNEGTISSSDVYQYQYEYTFYTEPENATRARYAWSEGPVRSYLYQLDPFKPLQCNSNTYLNETNFSGANFVSIIPPSADPSHCHTLCCSYMSCAVWTYAASASTDYNDCRKGQPCCYLKTYITQASNSTIYLSAIMNRTFPYIHPPSGMRSAVPLGGITTGSIELRGDGTFHEWTIENQSPATGTKYGLVDNALLAFRIKNLQTNQSDTRLIRTHPNHNLKGIQTIKYHGAYPVSKFKLIDNTLMGNIDLYAYSILKPGDLNRSMTPAIIFSLNIENSNNFPINIDFMYNAPLSAQIDQTRQSKQILQVVNNSYTGCILLCDENIYCASWNWQIIENVSTCILYSDVQYNEYLSGYVSGIRGQWTYNKTGPLVLDRPGNSSSNGQFVLWPFLSSDQTMTATINNDINNILNDFSLNGGWFNQTEIKGAAMNGAVSISTKLNPGEKKTLSILFAWYFPHHYWLDLPIDNYYSLLFTNVTNVGQSIGIDKNDSQLKIILQDILTLHNLYLNSNLPDYLVDSLINSVSHMRSAMYFSNGDWRQWEAYDCSDVDSVHNDHQRHLPYILYFPQTEKIKMYAWAKYQQTDGMIQETFTPGCTGSTHTYDQPGGRRMGDVTTIFILETLELYRWTNDMKFLKDMYPHVLAGIQWQLNVSSQLGLPEHLECTYDIPDMSQYPTTTFNSFLHLAALRACLELAIIMNDKITFNKCFDPLNTVVKQINQLLWHMDSVNTGYFLAYTGGKGEKAIFTDALYGQVLAYTYGLGPLYNITIMKKHLESEVRLADTLYGLRMLTGREPLTNPQDNSIWMGASQDWSVLNLWFNMESESALMQSKKSLNHVRQILNDQWNVHGLYAGDGYGIGGKPWVTSHYGFHMVLWHLPFALSGQYTDLSKGILTFSPKLRSPFILPVLIPNTFGSISATPIANDQSSYTLTLLIGNLTLTELSINNVQYPGSVNLTAGQSIQWSG
jgi:non-lysosomal glucosylceramidase